MLTGPDSHSVVPSALIDDLIYGETEAAQTGWFTESIRDSVLTPVSAPSDETRREAIAQPRATAGRGQFRPTSSVL